jgi:hypothetical protein
MLSETTDIQFPISNQIKMPKVLNYCILSNHMIWEKYKNQIKKVFKANQVPWTESKIVNGFWSEFDDETFYNYKDLIQKVSLINDDLLSNPCDYYREMHYFYSTMLYQLQPGQTLFVKYE